MPREKFDIIETEVKFPLLGRHDEATLEVLREALPSGFELTMFPGLVQLDLYLDTDDDFLLRTGATLRFRTTASRRRIGANFKPPRAASDRAMLRREVRTSYLPVEAAAEWKAEDHQGLAFKEYAEFHRRETGGASSPALGGAVWMESYRRGYLILPPDRRDDADAEPLIAIVFDDVRALRIDPSVTDTLLLTRRLDATVPMVEARFEVGEVESCGEHCGYADVSADLFEVLTGAVESRLPDGFELRTKYETARQLLP